MDENVEVASFRGKVLEVADERHGVFSWREDFFRRNIGRYVGSFAVGRRSFPSYVRVAYKQKKLSSTLK